MTEKKNIYYKLLKGNMGLRVVLTSEETISARGQSVFFFPLNKRKQLYHACDKCQIPF